MSTPTDDAIAAWDAAKADDDYDEIRIEPLEEAGDALRALLAQAEQERDAFESLYKGRLDVSELEAERDRLRTALEATLPYISTRWGTVRDQVRAALGSTTEPEETRQFQSQLWTRWPCPGCGGVLTDLTSYGRGETLRVRGQCPIHGRVTAAEPEEAEK